MKLSDITLLLGVDRVHLKELQSVWPSWMQFKPELNEMPVVVFYDSEEVSPEQGAFVQSAAEVKWVPWAMSDAQSQREEMLTGFIHIAARHVSTPWYLKLDTDVMAGGAGQWILPDWFLPDKSGRLPVFITSSWGYTKPRYLMDLLDDWGDRIPELSRKPRLNLPYSSTSDLVSHPRISSWLFFGRTDWTRQVADWLKPSGRLPYPSQDSLMFYCAKRAVEHFVNTGMHRYQWHHRRVRPLSDAAKADCNPLALQEHAANSSKERGVVYYNMGAACVARLLVSLYSLRKHYSGPVTILSEGDESHQLCSRIAAALDAEMMEWSPSVSEGRKHAYLAKTCIGEATPYELTVFLDADTLVRGPIDELFDAAEEFSFCVPQFTNWRSDGSTIRGRILKWQEWLPDLMDAAVNFGPAVNVGVFSFKRGSSLMKDWYQKAELGRSTIIPDEISCQIILPQHPHRILDSRWNCSCKYGDPFHPDTKIVHYHGRKHCRSGLPYGGALWFETFEQVLKEDVAGVQNWSPAGDGRLSRYLKELGRLKKVRRAGDKVTTSEIKEKIQNSLSIKLVLNAERVDYDGWVNTNRKCLDMRKEDDWKEMLKGRLADRLLAEHVLEHFSDEDLVKGLRLAYCHLTPGGSFRIAVPDGLHPDCEYLERVRPGGSGRSAHDHRQLFNHSTLCNVLCSVGFEVTKLEYWDEDGNFHRTSWNSADGHVKRSAGFDKRNKDGKLVYTSLIVDALKPLQARIIEVAA